MKSDHCLFSGSREHSTSLIALSELYPEFVSMCTKCMCLHTVAWSVASKQVQLYLCEHMLQSLHNILQSQSFATFPYVYWVFFDWNKTFHFISVTDSIDVGDRILAALWHLEISQFVFPFPIYLVFRRLYFWLFSSEKIKSNQLSNSVFFCKCTIDWFHKDG